MSRNTPLVVGWRSPALLGSKLGILFTLLAGHLSFAQFSNSDSTGGSGSTGGRSSGGRSQGMESSPEMRTMERLPIFFPPQPPPLGRPVTRTGATATRLVAPRELSQFVNEPFYPQLSTRMFTRGLSPKQRAALESYRKTKFELQAELRAEIDRVRDLNPVERGEALAAFSRKQTPRVIALENAAEQLRRNLSGGDIAWSALRQWKLNDGEKRGYSPIEIAQVMRSYAYYQNGLLPAQRRLLREISIELQMAGDSTANATAAQPYLFFPPEPARVLMPDDASAEIAAKFAAYQTKKSQLKKELYDAVYAHDGVRLGFLRGNSLATLAEKQNARLNELETLAEEIRRGLAQVTEPTRVTERSPLPPLLQGRVDRLITSYLAKQREAGARIDTLIQEGKDLPMQATYRFESDSLKYMVIPSGGGRGRGGRGGPGGPGGRGGSSRGAPSPEASARVDELRANIGVIADDYGRFMAEVINEKNAIRKEIADIMGNAKADAIDNALLAALRVATARDTEDSYRDYRVAVFQPGLSPEQRRLLFDRVIEGLNLPLPSGELQPSVRASSW